MSILLSAAIALPCLLMARRAARQRGGHRQDGLRWLIGACAASIVLFWALLFGALPSHASLALQVWPAALLLQLAGHAVLVVLMLRGWQDQPVAKAVPAASAFSRPSVPAAAGTAAPTPEPKAATRVEPAPAPAPAPAQARPTVFVSYRRSDSSDVTGRIHDRLVESLGREHVFTDVDSIPLGVDFREHVASILERTDCMLTVIGPDWLRAPDDSGQRRLDATTDLVRIEIEAALARGVPVIPLLVRGAAMPTEGDLPTSLRALAFRNGMAVRPNPDFHRDLDRLEQQLRALPQRRQAAAP